MVKGDIIELNGKRYDAATGAYIGKGSVSVTPALAHAKQGRTIDSVRRAGATKAAPHHPHLAATAAVTNTHYDKQHTQHPAKPLAQAHKPQRAKTLMRHTLKKPQTTRKTAVKPQAPAEVMATPVATIAPKHAVHTVDHTRLARSYQTPTHQKVSRFAHTSRPSYVAAMPLVQPAVPAAYAGQPAPANIFETAMAGATSHKQPKVALKKRRRSGLPIVLMVGLALVSAGLVAYANRSNIQLRMASFRAGFTAHMPSYRPTGYRLDGPIDANHGVVTLHFRSGDSTYQISQQTSNWNSQTLLDSMVGFQKYSTTESQGRTVYLYDTGKAAWVNGGIRYDITSNAHLSKDDLIALASSL